MSKSSVEVFYGQVRCGLILRELDAFVERFAPDCVLHDLVEAEPRVGRAAVREWAAGYLADMTDTSVEYLRVFSEGELVLGEFVIHCVYRGGKSTTPGSRVALRFCVIDEIRDGLVQHETVYSVPGELERQLATTSPVTNSW